MPRPAPVAAARTTGQPRRNSEGGLGPPRTLDRIVRPGSLLGRNLVELGLDPGEIRVAERLGLVLLDGTQGQVPPEGLEHLVGIDRGNKALENLDGRRVLQQLADEGFVHGVMGGGLGCGRFLCDRKGGDRGKGCGGQQARKLQRLYTHRSSPSVERVSSAAFRQTGRRGWRAVSPRGAGTSAAAAGTRRRLPRWRS